SQVELALLAGVSQRHRSCVDTARAKASPSTLHALQSALDVPLEQCNDIFHSAGFAPRYVATAPDHPAMNMEQEAVGHLL
ncbi:transcriptional regulator, partial [Pseudomonas sp. BJa5]